MAGFVSILLAAGKSQRMGEPKALLNWGGISLVQYQVSTLIESGSQEVIVVLGHNAELIEPHLKGFSKVRCVINEDYMLGRTSSIKVGVKAIGIVDPDCILFLNVDQPRNTEVIARLLLNHKWSRNHITVPTYDGKGGHPIIFGTEFTSDLLNITEETFGFRSIMTSHTSKVERVSVSDPCVLWDLNTPEQYADALQNLNM
ncbi:MAG: hypothetical protein CL886_08205 [Dehalococcoidia bacterium]|nr:hypothetical protein [Dehalococcoidia bacterium]